MYEIYCMLCGKPAPEDLQEMVDDFYERHPHAPPFPPMTCEACTVVPDHATTRGQMAKCGARRSRKSRPAP